MRQRLTVGVSELEARSKIQTGTPVRIRRSREFSIIRRIVRYKAVFRLGKPYVELLRGRIL